MRSILLDHTQRYPAWGLEDVYKLIHQAAMGSEHSVTDVSQARERLMQELTGMGQGPAEPLLDPISPDGRIVRIHLRRFADLGFETEALVQAFVQTARLVPPSLTRLAEYAGAALRLAEEGVLRWPGGSLAAYLAERQAGGYPAVHHSPDFADRYRPAYRVVAWELLPEDMRAPARKIAGAGPASGQRE